MHDVDVISDRTGVDRLQQCKGRTRIEHLGPAHVLQREPDLLAVRRRREVRAERACLRDLADDLVVGHRDHVGLRIE
jgi:hypothetical protein